MLGVARRDAGGSRGHRVRWVAEFFRSLNSGLELANAGKILVEFVVVARVEPALHGSGVFQDKIENGTLFLPAADQAFGALAGRPGAEEPLEDLARIGFGRHLRFGANP